MKKVYLILILAIAGCRDMGQEPPVPTEIDLTNVQGIIQKVSSDLYVINVATYGTYIPLNLPSDFRVDKLPVLLTGRTVIFPLNIAYPGTPLRISSITKRR
jgi:hypothetical protein